MPGAYEAFDPHITLQISQLHRYWGDMCSAAAHSAVTEANGATADSGVPLEQSMTREAIVRELVETNLLHEFDSEGDEMYVRACVGLSSRHAPACQPLFHALFPYLLLTLAWRTNANS